MTWFLIAVRQEVKRIDNSVVVHALKSKVQNRNDGKSVIARILTMCILASALVKHTGVGSNWVNSVILIWSV